MMKSVLEYRDKRFALVLVDMQKRFVDSFELESSVNLHMDSINNAIRLFRDTANPIIYVLFDGDEPEGSESLVDGIIRPVDGDIILHKTEMNSFRKTVLAETIKGLGCECVVIAGLAAQFCILATYFGAFDNDLVPYMLDDGLISSDEPVNKMVLEICKNLSVEELSENIFLKG